MNALQAITERPRGGSSLGEYFVDDLFGRPDPPAPSRATTAPLPAPQESTPQAPGSRERSNSLSPLAVSSIGALVAMVLVLGFATSTLVGVVVFLLLGA